MRAAIIGSLAMLAAAPALAQDRIPERFLGQWGQTCDRPMVEFLPTAARLLGVAGETHRVSAVAFDGRILTLDLPFGRISYEVLGPDLIQGLLRAPTGGLNPPMRRCTPRRG